jgi:hypothetical protein
LIKQWSPTVARLCALFVGSASELGIDAPRRSTILNFDGAISEFDLTHPLDEINSLFSVKFLATKKSGFFAATKRTDRSLCVEQLPTGSIHRQE